MPVRVPWDVLTEETGRPALIDDADNLVDKEAIVEHSQPLSGDAVSLAWISGSDAMNAATPRSSVEGGKVRPDRRWSQIVRFHAMDQLRGSRGFPLHVSDCTRSGHGKLNSEAKPSGSGA